MAKGDSYIIKGLPADLMTTQIVDNRELKTSDESSNQNWQRFFDELTYQPVIDKSFVKVSTLNRVEAYIAQGFLFSTSIAQSNTTIDSDVFYVLRTGTKAVSLETIEPAFDYSSMGDGIFEYRLWFFDPLSDGNDWSYTGGSPFVPAARNINTNYLVEGQAASKTESQVSSGGTVNLTGEPDFELIFASISLDLIGQGLTSSTTLSKFFNDGRRLILRPNSDYLFLARTSGTATGTMSINTQISLSEIEQVFI